MIATPGERISWVMQPLMCKVAGHDRRKKMNCDICMWCSVVLPGRGPYANKWAGFRRGFILGNVVGLPIAFVVAVVHFL